MPNSRRSKHILAMIVALLSIGITLVIAIAQETPVGSLSGTVIAQDTGNPIEADVFLTSPDKRVQRRTRSDKDGEYRFGSVPAGEYNLQASSKAHELKQTPITIREGEKKSIDIEAIPMGPSLELYAEEHIFTPDEHSRVTVRGWNNAESIDTSIYKVNLNSFLLQSGGDLSRLLGYSSFMPDQREKQKLDLSANKSLSLAKSFSEKIKGRDVEGVFMQKVLLPTLAPGLYVVSAKAGDLQRLDWIMVTTLGMVTKTSGAETLAFATDIKTGKPISASEVSVFVGNRLVTSGRTNSDGVLRLRLPSIEKGESHQTIIARSGESFAFVSSYLSSAQESRRTIYTYTERPVYKPGQMVYFRGLVREGPSTRYRAAAHLPMTVEVRDSKDTLIYRTTARTDSFGSYAGSFALNKETATGNYTILSTPEGESRGESAYFQVAAYRKPEFEVKVKLQGKHCPVGSTVHASVSANYYFGAPVTNATVNFVVRREIAWMYGEDEEQDTEGYQDYGGYGEVVSSGTVLTDSQGNADISFVTKPDESVDLEGYGDQNYTVEASVSDASRNETTGTGSILVTQGDFHIEARTDSYITSPGGKTGLSIHVLDYDNKPVARQKVRITVGMQSYSKTGESSFRKTEELSAMTDDQGGASVEFATPEPGDVKAIVTGVDKQGRSISTAAYVWCYREGFADMAYAESDLDIVTDKKIYKPGETARVLMNTKSTGATALVTVEGDRVYESRVIKLSSVSTMISIPIKSEYKPNCYIAVCFVKNKTLTNKQKRVRVSIEQSALKIEIHPNKSRYLPGEKARFDIRATGPDGRPARAELSIGIVDEAIYAIEKDRTQNILDCFYARKANRIQTGFSFPEIYLSDPDKAGPSLLKTPPSNTRIRKRFEDTAFWNPTVVTGANGRASVSFEMPDNLTTWRATVRGADSGSSFGQATSQVTVQQDFLVRLQTPRFLVQDDEAIISAIVHNYKDHDLQTRATLEAPGLRILGGSDRDVSVARNGQQQVTWRVRALSPGTKSILVRARTSETADAMEISIPVYPLGVKRITTGIGAIRTNGSRDIDLSLRTDAISGTTGLKVRLAPSYASSMLGALGYLAQYPYGCTEQTVSSFLPDVILSSSLKDMGWHNPELEAELPDMVTKGLLRLYRFQLPDGGWSWCQYGKADQWMTAYVCYALIRAGQSGFPVNKTVLDQGLSQLSEQVTTAKADPETTAYSLYVLSLTGREVSDRLDSLYTQANLSPKSIALITLAYYNLHFADKAEAALSRLFAGSISDSGMIYWKSPQRYGDEFVEPTAFGLEALLRLHPGDERATGIVRWLMQQRTYGCWYSTRETAMVLYATSLFLKDSKELTPDSNVVVMLNGKIERKVHFGKASVLQPDIEIDIPSQHLQKGTNHLEIRKSGIGNVYWSTELTQYVSSGLSNPTIDGSGLSITRTYHIPSSPWYDLDSNEIGRVVTGSDAGDTVIVRLTVYNKTSINHLLLEDYLPAGCEIQYQGERDYWDWRSWWVGQDVRDEKVSFYLDYLPPGKHTVQYRMRGAFPGDYHALPAQVFAMYDPEKRASTAASEFRVR